MVDDPNLNEKFREFIGVSIKHNLKINVYQYIEKNDAINSNLPDDLVMTQRLRGLKDKMFEIASLADNDDDDEIGKDKLVGILEAMTNSLSTIKKSKE